MTTRPDAAQRGGTRPIVVKLGGSTLGAHDTSLRDIAAAHAAGRAIVVVHGGGAAVTEWLERAGIAAKFVRGLRVTDAATLDVVVAVLAGLVNTQLVAQLNALHAPAVGLTGASARLLEAERYDNDLGFVGRITTVNARPLEDLLADGHLPVIAPIALEIRDGDAADRSQQLLNTNADTAAGEIAAALGAEQLIFLTDVDGVLDEQRQLQPSLTAETARALIASGAAAGGMIPKLEAAIRAATAGTPTRIINGTTAGALSHAIAGEDTGTIVTA